MTSIQRYVVSRRDFAMKTQVADSSEDREIELIHDLAQRVLVHEEMLNVVSDILGELDW